MHDARRINKRVFEGCQSKDAWPGRESRKFRMRRVKLTWSKIDVASLSSQKVRRDDADGYEETSARLRSYTERKKQREETEEIQESVNTLFSSPSPPRRKKKISTYRIPNDRVPDEVILALLRGPAAHPQSQVEPRPVERFGGEDVFLVWVRDEGVVGGHHGHVEMPKVGEEGGAVEFGVALGDWGEGKEGREVERV
jgi:hypothetical protein